MHTNESASYVSFRYNEQLKLPMQAFRKQRCTVIGNTVYISELDNNMKPQVTFEKFFKGHKCVQDKQKLKKDAML
jgi:hypothetical protein